MKDITTFNFGAFPIRQIFLPNDDQPWFVAKDVGFMLGLTNIRQNLEKMPSYQKGVYTIYTLGGSQNVNVVNEAGFYALIFKSNKPFAEDIQKWVFTEVLPQIRKTGSYISEKMQQEVSQLKQDMEAVKAFLPKPKKIYPKTKFRLIIKVFGIAISMGKFVTEEEREEYRALVMRHLKETQTTNRFDFRDEFFMSAYGHKYNTHQKYQPYSWKDNEILLA